MTKPNFLSDLNQNNATINTSTSKNGGKKNMKDYSLGGKLTATTWQEFRAVMKEAGINTGTKTYEQLVQEYTELTAKNTVTYSTEVDTADEAYWKNLTRANVSNKELQWQAIMANAPVNKPAVTTEESMVAAIMKKLLRRGIVYEATKLHAPLDKFNNKKLGTVRLKVIRAIVFNVYNSCHTEQATGAEVDAVLDYMVQNHIVARDYFDGATGKVPQYIIPNATWNKYGVKNFIKA